MQVSQETNLQFYASSIFIKINTYLFADEHSPLFLIKLLKFSRKAKFNKITGRSIITKKGEGSQVKESTDSSTTIEDDDVKGELKTRLTRNFLLHLPF
jgi:hypothetical protein